MGYIEDRKAEGVRQAFEAAKQAEAARVLNQGNPDSLALQAAKQSGLVSDVPLQLTPEQASSLIRQNQAADVGRRVPDEYANIQDQIARNLEFNAARKAINNAPLKYNTRNNHITGESISTPYREVDRSDLETVSKYRDSIDPGLAAKYAKMREAYDRYK